MGWVILLLVVWFLVAGPIGSALGKAIKDTREESEEFDRLAERLKNTHKERVEQLIRYHNSRVNNGASGQESFARLIRDMKALLPEDEQEELF